MAGGNLFPESDEKAFLRLQDLVTLAEHKRRIRHNLAYLGLPSAEMLDVKVWQSVLGHVTAIERDPVVSTSLLRTAQKLGIRSHTILIERPLAEVFRVLALDDADANRSLAAFPDNEREKIRRVRGVSHDVINLDFYGGLIYQGQLDDVSGANENAQLFRNLIKCQSRHKSAFILILTLNLRDSGSRDYDDFIKQTLDLVDAPSGDTSDVRRFYTAASIKNQPPQLRRLRFCVPVYLLKIAFEAFKVSDVSAWYYKTFYHASLLLEPRPSTGALGSSPWPPVDELKTLLGAPMMRIEATGDGNVTTHELPAPTLE